MPSPRGDSTAFTVLWLHCLSHPDSTVGIGISPIHARRLADCTAGWESHPAPKTIPMKLRPYYNTSPDARKGGPERQCASGPRSHQENKLILVRVPFSDT